MAAIGWGSGAVLSAMSRRKLIAAAAASHLRFSWIDGWTMRSQVAVTAVGDRSSRSAPAAAGPSSKSPAPSAGAQRRITDSGAGEVTP